MPYAPLHEKFPDIAEKETRTLTVFDLPDLPQGRYGFVEAYCYEPGCDCRRVFFNVVDWQTGEIKAVIAYGWESKEFYAKWLGYDDPAILRELQGPALNSASHQSQLAPALLKQMTYILDDRSYVDRLMRHYKMYKAAIDKGAGKQKSGRRRELYEREFIGSIRDGEYSESGWRLNNGLHLTASRLRRCARKSLKRAKWHQSD